MKTLLFILTLVSFTFPSWAQVAPPSIMPGIGATYAVELESPGLNLRTYYAADHHFCFGPEVSIFNPVRHDDVENKLFEANINLHYILELTHRWAVYPFGGINYSLETERELLHNSSHSIAAFGANVGAGVHYLYGPLLFFTEYKYVISNLDDHFPTLGVLYNFTVGKKHEAHSEHM